jgi:hypothetical protein
MIRICLAALCLTLLWLGAAQAPTDWRRLEESRKEAVRLLKESAVASNGGSHTDAARLLASAARSISLLSRDGNVRLPTLQQKRLNRLSLDLAALSAGCKKRQESSSSIPTLPSSTSWAAIFKTRPPN